MGPIAGPIVNVIGLIYNTIAFVFSFFPSSTPVTPASMNWSSLLFGFSVMFSVGFYFFYGRHAYRWPIVDPIRRNQ